MTDSTNESPGKPRPPQKAFRLSDQGREILTALSQKLGINQTAVIEIALRDKAKSENVKVGAE